MPTPGWLRNWPSPRCDRRGNANEPTMERNRLPLIARQPLRDDAIHCAAVSACPKPCPPAALGPDRRTGTETASHSGYSPTRAGLQVFVVFLKLPLGDLHDSGPPYRFRRRSPGRTVWRSPPKANSRTSTLGKSGDGESSVRVLELVGQSMARRIVGQLRRSWLGFVCQS